MQCHLKGMHINEVPKFLADNFSLTTDAIQIADPLNAVHPLIIQLQLSIVISGFGVYSLSIAEYVNEDIPKIYLTAEEPA